MHESQSRTFSLPFLPANGLPNDMPQEDKLCLFQDKFSLREFKERTTHRLFLSALLTLAPLMFSGPVIGAVAKPRVPVTRVRTAFIPWIQPIRRIIASAIARQLLCTVIASPNRFARGWFKSVLIKYFAGSQRRAFGRGNHIDQFRRTFSAFR